MATQQNTLDKITGWASDKYTAASPSLTTGAAPAAAAAPASSTGLLGAAATPAVQTGTTWAQANSTAAPTSSTNQPYTINQTDLASRTINQPTETVQGQLGSLLKADNPVLQQAEAEGMRTASDRGLGNSTMAASAGSDALIRAATGIATTDSGYYNKASDYNVAAKNQATMYNADQTNAFRQAQMSQDAAANQLDKQLAATRSDSDAGRAQALTIAQMQDGTTKAGYSNQLAIAGMQDATTKAGQANQMSIAQMQDATTRLAQANGNDKDTYNQKLSVANNIISNMDLSPDRKAAMLEQLGFGTSAAAGKAGTGLAGAVYVIDSTSADLQPGNFTDHSNAQMPSGPLGSAIARGAQQQNAATSAAADAADKATWGTGRLS